MIVAIDPGANGGLAFETPWGELPLLVKMPDTPKDILDQLGVAGVYKTAVLEKVGTHMQGNNASASCKFARHCGHVEMALIAQGYKIVDVTPQKWMKWLGVPSRLEKTARKNFIKDKMQRAFPGAKVTLWNADALAILHWYKETK